MARKPLSRSLIARAEAAAEVEPPVRGEGRPLAGAWRAGATEQLRADLEAGEADMVARILDGRAELSLDAERIEDPLGSDRRPDWRKQDEFKALKASIAANGQDMPVQVAPIDPGWQPDPRKPHDTGEARFALLAGRRRLAALQELGLPVRAVLIPVEGEGAARHAAMLTRRWRENAERADLSPFERLLAIGEMFDAAKAADDGETAAAFGAQIGVSESVVSRARAVAGRRDDIIAAVPDPYALSNTALYTLLPRLDAAPAATPAPPRPAMKATRKAGSLSMAAKISDGTLTLTAKGLPDGFDAPAFERLLDDIARKLKKEAKTGG